MATYNLTVNENSYTIDAEPNMPLLWAIRDFVELKSTKFGYGMALCGACTVHLTDLKKFLSFFEIVFYSFNERT